MKKMFAGVMIAALSVCVAARAEDVKIGVSMPLSGALSAYGKNTLDGIQFRVKQVNDAGGIGGRKIVLVVEDNKGEKADTRSSVKKLAEIDNVAAIIGPITSTNALAAKMDAQRSKVVLMSPTATNDRVTANSEYVFRACFNDSFQGTIVANYATKELKLKKAAVLIDKSSDYSKGLSASFKKAFEAGGGAVVAEEGYQQKDTDFGSQLIKIKESGAEILFVPGYPPELPLIIKQAKVVGYAGKFCGADGWDSEALFKNASDNIEGSFLVGAFSPEDQRKMVKDFVKGMKDATGRTPGSFEALGYDSMLLLGEAMKAGMGREDIRKGLLAIKDVEAVTGKITMGPKGDAVKSAAILKITKDGDNYVTRFLASVAP